jgi:hypothetical protein
MRLKARGQALRVSRREGVETALLPGEVLEVADRPRRVVEWTADRALVGVVAQDDQ